MNDMVSVIIPTYNGSKVVLRAVQSVINQTYRNIEIIVVDDNGIGTEEQIKTKTVLEKLIDKKKIIYITHKVNCNGSVARNTGVKESHGEFICLLDDDDEYKPHKVEMEVKLLKKLDDTYAMVYCSIDIYCGNEFVKCKRAINKDNMFESLLLHEVIIGSDTLMIKKDRYLEINGFDESFRRHQDFEFTARVAMKWKIRAIYETGVIGHTLNRNSPKNLKMAVEYRKHYISKMFPYMDCFDDKKKKLIISSNFVSLYGKEIRQFKLFKAYSEVLSNINIFIKEYSFFDFLGTIIYTILHKD